MLKISHSIENYHTSNTEAKHTEPYIIFTVDNEEFGVEAQKVLELVKYMAPLKMPNNFVNVHGMAIFRGKIIPIIDLRMIFGLGPVVYGDDTVTIVVESSISAFGITAERVLDLNFIPVASIKKVTAFNFGEKTKYLKSVAIFSGHLVLLLDLDKMIETKPAQAALEVPGQPESFTKVEAPSFLPEIKAGGQSIPEKICAADPASDISLEDGGGSQPFDTVPELLEPQTGPVSEEPQLTQPEEAEVEYKKSSNCLIDPKELEDLLNRTAPKPEQEAEECLNIEPQPLTETEGIPLEETDSAAKNDQALVDPMEPERILTEFELEKEKVNELSDQSGPKFDTGSNQALNKEQASLESTNALEGVLKPEQVESDLAVNYPKDLFQMKATTEMVNLNQTGQGLSDKVIEGILKELEAESQAGLKGLSPGNGNQCIQLDGIEASEEKPDV